MAKGTKNKKVEAVEAQAILDTVNNLDLTKVVSDIGTLQVTLQNTLANLSTTMSTKFQQVEQLDTAIDLKESRLQELYGIEKEAVNLDDMKAQKEEEINKWNQEEEERNATWAEEEAERAKKWKRSEEEYTYATLVNRKKAQDDFDALLAKSKREEAERADLLNKTWAERENTLKGKEQELNDLRTQVAGFDTRLKSEISKAEAVLGNVLKKQYEHEKVLLEKDASSERNLHSIKVSAMNDTIENLQAQIQQLQTQLVAARSDAKEVATQALQSASERKVSEALSRVVDQRDTQTKTK